MAKIKRAKRPPHALVHFVTARASLVTDHRISGLPMARHVQPLSDELSQIVFH